MGVKRKIILLGLTAIIAIVYIGFKFLEHKSEIWKNGLYLSAVPPELNVDKVLYRNEEVRGFGPGANEAGIRVYELPDNIAKTIKEQGIEYLKNLPSSLGKRNNWRGRYSSWSETPVKVTEYWVNYDVRNKKDYSKEIPSISNYVNYYCCGIEIDTEIQDLVNNAISNPGNYYAYGRIGVIIVIPSLKRVVYAYNG